MAFLSAFKVALTALAANKLRSSLAILGIVIGIFSMIAMTAMGRGAQMSVEESIAKMGVNLVFIWPGNTSRGGGAARNVSAETLTLDDVEALRTVDHVGAIAPEVRRYYQVKHLSKNSYTQVTGTTPPFLAVRGFEVANGEFFDKSAVLGRSRVAVLGAVIARDLFGDVDPLGRTIQIDRKNFQVIGVLADKGGDTWARLDETVYVPVTTALYRLFNRRHLSQISVSVDSPANIDAAMEVIEDELIKRHRIVANMDPDFTVSSMNEMRQGSAKATEAFTNLLAGIAVVSLLVGGIGIMNIMLVSVTERTREIGIRRAVGARRRDIIRQFLIEAMTISILGGVAGILLGVGGTQVVAKLPVWGDLSRGGTWQAVVDPGTIALAFGFSALVGIFAGIYPALKASRLHPVEALRYE